MPSQLMHIFLLFQLLNSTTPTKVVSLAVTIDKDAKFKFSGASVTPGSKEHSTQGPTTTLLLMLFETVTKGIACATGN